MPHAIAKSGTIRPYNTTVIIDDDGNTVCTLYQTKIALYNPKLDTVFLNTGGFDTPTTIRRMNECLNAWGFKQRVNKASFAKSDTVTLARTTTSLMGAES